MNSNRTEQFKRFREEYPEFVYRGYKYTETDLSLEIAYHFEITGLAEFHPSWNFLKLEPHPAHEDNKQLEDLIFSLGMVELISYWKLTCSPNVFIKTGSLSPNQVKWWKKLYLKGLGEFFYTNGISANDDFMKIFCSQSDTCGITLQNKTSINPNDGLPKVLIPVGGGKDSAVTIELLENAAERFLYIINPRQATFETANVSGLRDKTIISMRKLDANITTLNAKGFLNGHTPFSAVVAFSSVIAAYLNGINYVALSNESSANEATVMDSDVNHQYSKSYEFERDFINYESTYIGCGVNYFSMLRPLTEFQIAKLFASYKKYHGIFKSCNAGSKTDIWCGNCPKCLFVYIILSPFLSADELIDIFGRDMLNDSGLTEIFEKLTGLQPEKPFECVGSRDEVKAALNLTVSKYKAEGKPLPILLNYFKEKFNNDLKEKNGALSFLEYFDENNSLPPYFLSLIKEKILI